MSLIDYFAIHIVPKMYRGKGALHPVPTGKLTDVVNCVREYDVNIFFLRKGESLIAIDAGYKRHPGLLARCRKIGVDPSTVQALFLTHADPDHAGGLDIRQENPFIEGEGQAAIRAGCGIVHQAAPELFAEGGDLSVLMFQYSEEVLHRTAPDADVVDLLCDHILFGLGLLVLLAEGIEALVVFGLVLRDCGVLPNHLLDHAIEHFHLQSGVLFISGWFFFLLFMRIFEHLRSIRESDTLKKKVQNQKEK